MFSDYHTVIQDFNQLLKTMVEREASDLFITAGLPPSLKIHGRVDVNVLKQFGLPLLDLRHGSD